MELTQRCTVCKRLLPYDCFHKCSRTKNGIRHQCKECRAKESALWRAENYEEITRKRRTKAETRKARRNAAYNDRVRTDPNFHDEIREKTVKLRYGLDRGDYEELLSYQSNNCAICGVPRKETLSKLGYKINLGVDHNHDTNEVRGLLCPVCNAALGFLESDRYPKALKYLENPPFRRMLLERKQREKVYDQI